MQVFWTLVLVSAILGHFFENFCSCASIRHVFAKDLVEEEETGGSADAESSLISSEEAASYELDATDQLGKLLLDSDDVDDKILVKVRQIRPGLPQGVQKISDPALARALQRRGKRYVSYRMLCHFKICNMGRKRPRPYPAEGVTRRDDDNDV